jgi:hypothetical protein
VPLVLLKISFLILPTKKLTHDLIRNLAMADRLHESGDNGNLGLY